MPDDTPNSALGDAALGAAAGPDPSADAAVRETKLTLRLGDEQFDLLGVSASEGLSQPFFIVIDVLSQLGAFDLMPHLGTEAVVESLRDGEHMRYFHGVITDGHLVGEASTGSHAWSAGAHHYRLTLQPKAYFHSHGSDFRIFQDKTVFDIVKHVFEERGIDYADQLSEMSGAQRSLKYCVQFGESDMAFVFRLLEEHGIYYFYRHSKDKHEIVLCDGTASHTAGSAPDFVYHPFASSMANTGSELRGEKVEAISEWQEFLSTGAERTAYMRDFDFTRPQMQLQGKLDDSHQHQGMAIEMYQWPGRFYDPSTGDGLAKYVLEQRRAGRVRYEGATGCTAMQTGYTFTLGNHPISRFNMPHCVIATHTTLSVEAYRSSGGGGDTAVHFTAIPAHVPFRAPMVTPRPVAQGPETAIVVGPAGEEIHVDNYGRIKVQFHWDRVGVKDDHSSCWVRVSQTGGLGNMIIPRIGQEVLINFINGNPDRPIVVGRLYNAGDMPIYTLPANKTRAVWRSKTYKRTESQSYPGAEPDQIEDGKPAANEIRFEDKTGEEEFYIHAEKDLNTRVRHDETHFVAKDQTIKVRKNQTIEVHVDRTEEVWGDEKITLHQNRTETVTQNETLSVSGDRSDTITGNDTLKVTGNISMTADGKIDITSTQKITLTCGQSSIEMTPTGIKINSTDVEASAMCNAKLSGMAEVSVESAAMAKISAGIVNIN